jgi:hypothetical protein
MDTISRQYRSLILSNGDLDPLTYFTDVSPIPGMSPVLPMQVPRWTDPDITVSNEGEHVLYMETKRLQHIAG